MDGDIAPLDEITKLAREYGAMTYIDDCHGEGVLAGGRGIGGGGIGAAARSSCAAAGRRGSARGGAARKMLWLLSSRIRATTLRAWRDRVSDVHSASSPLAARLPWPARSEMSTSARWEDLHFLFRAAPTVMSEEELKCSVCHELPPGEVHQCSRGHLLCVKCWNDLDKLPRRACPECRAPVVEAAAAGRASQRW